MKLSDYVLKFVADLGIKDLFLVTGGGAMHLNQSLGAETRIRPVCNSHEQASAICAEGYAKATNGLGVCMVTTGPGGTNAVTGVAGAWLDSTPTLYISGQVKRPDRMFDAVTGKPLGMRQLGVQEVDICSIVRPITKYAETVLEPNDIRYHLEKAVYLAMNGRPGPVWIDIPLDVQASPIEEANLRAFDPNDPAEKASLGNIHGTSDVPAEVAKVIDALNRAERQLLFAGNGIRLARAEKEFEELRQYLGIPTVATWCAADLVPSDDPHLRRPTRICSSQRSKLRPPELRFSPRHRCPPRLRHHRLRPAEPRARSPQGRRRYRPRGAAKAPPLPPAAHLRRRQNLPHRAP